VYEVLGEVTANEVIGASDEDGLVLIGVWIAD
jgi:hypothetical protein